ncbi:beta a protein [Ligustrum mosaic virus]|nr:beta a protein [Ligustrum mosaic virus]
MANLGLTVKGGGHYDETQWYNNVVRTSAMHDWWVAKESWKDMLDALSKVQFDVINSRRAIAEIIINLKRDLPAALDRRFAGSTGTLGAANYREAPLFVRLDGAARAHLTALARIGDQPSTSRDLELYRGKATVQQPASANPPAIKDIQPLRDGALHLTWDLKDLVVSDPPIYDRLTFEEQFHLVWYERVPVVQQ